MVSSWDHNPRGVDIFRHKALSLESIFTKKVFFLQTPDPALHRSAGERFSQAFEGPERGGEGSEGSGHHFRAAPAEAPVRLPPG